MGYEGFRKCGERWSYFLFCLLIARYFSGDLVGTVGSTITAQSLLPDSL